ncbi:MAG: LytTR family transcriptional regulator [Lachnospiraceae bacterium]|nr:LytTR family transcriptional regulator [Lachnospiraceae bacterium]MCI9184257.1 LytTR family transcriptional regulator [Lachnospiraceae bacterium]
MGQGSEKNYVWVFKGERIILKGKDICYVHTEQRKIFVHTYQKTYRVGGSLKEEEEKLKDLPMVKTHNAYLVHLDYLESISIRGAVLKNGVCIPVSENRWKKVRETVEKYYYDKLRSRHKIQENDAKLQKQTDFSQ